MADRLGRALRAALRLGPRGRWTPSPCRRGGAASGGSGSTGGRRGGGDVTDQVIAQPGAPAVESIDELGPVDWLVLEFPGGRCTGDDAPALDALVGNGTIRVLDLELA